jgi:hypothetical protein
MDYFNDKVQEYQSMIQEFSTGGRVGFASGGAKKGVESLIEMLNKKFGKGTAKKGSELKRPEAAEVKQMIDDFMERNPQTTNTDTIIMDIKKLEPIEAMKEVNEVVAKRGKYKNLSDEEVQKIFEDTNDHIFERDVPADEFAVKIDEEVDIEKGLNDLDELNFTKDASQVKKMLDNMDDVSGMTPKMVERFQLKERFPGIDDNLLTQIIDDPDPQRKAEVIATIDQAFELMRQGKSQEEVYDIMKQMTDRTKQAGGGLSYLSGF